MVRRMAKLKVTKKHIIARKVSSKFSRMYHGNIYFEIIYREVGADHDTIGFSSYYLDLVLEWFNNELELVEMQE